MSVPTLALVGLLAATPCQSEPGGIRFGRAVCAVPDQDGDGVTDFVVTAPYSVCEPQHAGMVHLFSGKTPELLRSFAGPEELATVGESVQWVERANGRGALLLASEGAAGSFLMSPDGSLLHRFGPELVEVVAARDWDCDGRVDFAAEKEGEVFLLSGESFEQLRTLPESIRGRLLGTAGDLDGDGGAELVVLTDSDPLTARIWSSRSDRARIELRFPEGADLRLPLEDWRRWVFATAGDIDADGMQDLALGLPSDERVFVFSGSTGSLLYDRKRRSNEAIMFGGSILGGEDLNGDGAPDLVVGGPDGFFVPAGIYVLSLAARDPLWRLEELERNCEVSYSGAALCFLDDRDGDGVREIPASGADVLPPHGVIHPVGSVRIVSGASGEELWYFDVAELPEKTRGR